MINTFLLLLLAQQNLVVNGDFESSTSSGCDDNNSNSTFGRKMDGCVGNGPGDEVNIMDSGSCYGPAGPVGPTRVAIHCDGDPQRHAFTKELSGWLPSVSMSPSPSSHPG